MHSVAATFDPAAFGEDVAAILRQGARFGLTAGSGRAELGDWFQGVRAPAGSAAGLALYQGDWTRAHEIAQDDPSAEGSYWHAIVHRLEPDAANAAYWFRRVGRHAIFPALAAEARTVWPAAPDPWDPLRFIAFCEMARAHPGGPEEEIALTVQMIEWRHLFAHCAGRA